MKQYYLRRAFELAIEEVDIPIPQKDQVVIKIEACGVCATDIHSYEGESIQKKFPFHPGHEIAGTVYSVGKGVTSFAIGDQVVVDPLYPCEVCEFCKNDQSNHCIQVKTLGTEGPGGYSDYTVVPAKNVYRFNRITCREATFAEPLASVIYGLSRAEIGPGNKVLINGAGPIGLLHLQRALQLGCSEVVVTDLVAEKLNMAQSFGASKVLLASAPDFGQQLTSFAARGFDAIIDCTGVPAVIERALAYLKRTGRLLIFGVCPQKSKIELNPFEIYRNDWKIIGAYALNQTMKTAVELLENRAIKVEKLIYRVMPRENLLEAFNLVKQGKNLGKIIIQSES